MSNKRGLILFFVVLLGCPLVIAQIELPKQRRSHAPSPSPRPTSPNSDRESILKTRLQALLPDVIVTDESVEDVKVKKHGKESDEEAMYQEIRVRWEVIDPKSPKQKEVLEFEPRANARSAGRVMKAIGRRQRKGELGQLRGLTLSSQLMVMVAVDASNHLRYWYVTSDPSLEASVYLTGEREAHEKLSQASQVDFFVGVPEDKEITDLRFYHPRWTGSEHVLELLGTVKL